MSPREKPDWVVSRNDLTFECRRCGRTQPMAGRDGTVDLNVYAAAGRAFLANHRRCRKPEATP